MSEFKHRLEDRCTLPCSMVCKNCPDYMYNFETLRETWTRASREQGKNCYERIKYYFNHSFDRHLKEMIFVVAYGLDHNAGIFLDFKGYELFKEKMEKAAEMTKNLPDVEPVKLSRKTPQIMRVFKTLKDFVIFNDQLRQKNRSIARQRHINGVHSLQRINETIDQKPPLFLAFNVKFFEQDYTKILQIGYVVFSLESEQDGENSHLFLVKENISLLNNNTQLENYDTSLFRNAEVARLTDIITKLQVHISKVDFLMTHSTSTEDIRSFLKSQGLHEEHKEIIDTLTLYSVFFPDSRKNNSIEDILIKLEIPCEIRRLQNAGYNAFCIMKIFLSLLKQEYCECLKL
ncbi:uncharacterized protein LOC111336109 [Stylophora pistillata]|uniref:uncharacterized protein LOC111336109 n=1 Tax=Stylophora pistillata TaxID=50429 RepID=UPI000C0540C0|nr:uncharacterized protein LOC111336109 [Stylophora pistillata]XP_022797876.1 uncharacterized protein LOC111336109 [Stylophora pistillata]XP_022797877.1 uncharacterized protein LOC111336109 [Stylophora pistillata]